MLCGRSEVLLLPSNSHPCDDAKRAPVVYAHSQMSTSLPDVVMETRVHPVFTLSHCDLDFVWRFFVTFKLTGGNTEAGCLATIAISGAI